MSNFTFGHDVFRRRLLVLRQNASAAIASKFVCCYCVKMRLQVEGVNKLSQIFFILPITMSDKGDHYCSYDNTQANVTTI